MYLDELGRERKTTIDLGADYGNQQLIAGDRTYDSHGRVVFEADPYPSNQTRNTAYGTSRFFDADGTLRYTVRAKGEQHAAFNGTQLAALATDETNEFFPTLFQRMFQDNTELVSAQDAASLLNGSPQFGVTKTSALTAIGRLLSRSTWSGATRLEHATFAHDRLGHQTGMTRYQDANNGAKPVTSSWHYDSLGQVLELDEPDSVPQFNSYSDWGELREVLRYASDPPDPEATGLRVLRTYDALGRLVHAEQRNHGVVDDETVNDYAYDVGIQDAAQVTPTFLHGRLARATSPTGAVSFSYDSFGRVNARVFTDHDGTYIEKHEFHGDGSEDKLHLLLPDTGYASDNVVYGYDSAGRGTSVKYDRNGANQKDLFVAQPLDPFGRLRQGTYGQASYAASYADVGRRLLQQVTVSSSFGSRAISYQGFDPVGRERSRIETQVNSNITTSTTSTFSYDALGRLTSTVKTTGNTPVLSQQFTYDPLGNLLTLTNAVANQGPPVTTLSYLETDRDRICHIAYGADNTTACNVTYDEIGNIVSQATATGQRQYSYLIGGNVRTISDERGTQAHFRYDAFGAVQQLDLTTSVSPDKRQDRHYGALMGRRLEGPPAGPQSAIHLRKIPGPHGLLATLHGPTPTGPWTFEFGEGRGNRFMTDQTGAFVQDVDYQAYGKASSTGAQPGTTKYTSAQWNFGDALSAFGISQLGARLYDPAIGRFLSRDPLLIPRTAATTNPYAFASNDPINRSDPSGLRDDEDKPVVPPPPPPYVLPPMQAWQDSLGDASGDSCLLCSGDSSSADISDTPLRPGTIGASNPSPRSVNNALTRALLAGAFNVVIAEAALPLAEGAAGGIAAPFIAGGILGGGLVIFVELVKAGAAASLAGVPGPIYGSDPGEAMAGEIGRAWYEADQEEIRNQRPKMLFRSMVPQNGAFVNSPLSGAPNAKQKGARTPSSVLRGNPYDMNVTSENDLVGPGYTTQREGLSASLVPRIPNQKGMVNGMILGEALPDGLGAVNDVHDHVTIFPARPMTFGEYQTLLNQIPWVITQ